MRHERHTRTSWKIKQALQRSGKATIARRYRDGRVLPCYVGSNLNTSQLPGEGECDGTQTVNEFRCDVRLDR